MGSKEPDTTERLSTQHALSQAEATRGKGVVRALGSSLSGEAARRTYMMRARSLSPVRICDLVDYSSIGSSVHGILQARILERIALSSSRGSSQPRVRTRISYVSCFGGRVLYHHHLGSPYIWSWV